MVHLKKQSEIDTQKYPLTNRWDTMMRENYDYHQGEIDRHTYDIQRAQKGFAIFGHWTYPYLHHKTHALKELMQKRQLLGALYDHEVAEFESINSNIRADIERTFGKNAYFYR